MLNRVCILGNSLQHQAFLGFPQAGCCHKKTKQKINQYFLVELKRKNDLAAGNYTPWMEAGSEKMSFVFVT